MPLKKTPRSAGCRPANRRCKLSHWLGLGELRSRLSGPGSIPTTALAVRKSFGLKLKEGKQLPRILESR
jgi:hypothetical protein